MNPVGSPGRGPTLQAAPDPQELRLDLQISRLGSDAPRVGPLPEVDAGCEDGWASPILLRP